MGTNYYARTLDTPPDEDGLHIGKSSGGWEFTWHGYVAGTGPERLESAADWHAYLSRPDVYVFTETGIEVEFARFWWPTATDRSSKTLKLVWVGKPSHSDEWRDEYGHPFRGCDFC